MALCFCTVDIGKKLSGGYRLTTNNRMEIMAAIAGLQALRGRCCRLPSTRIRSIWPMPSPQGWAKTLAGKRLEAE